MSIFIGYESALECLRAPIFSGRVDTCRALPRIGCVPTEAILSRVDLEAAGVKGFPVQLVVASASSRGKASCVSCHVWAGPSSTKSFVHIEDGLYVSSPEACFLQLAGVLSAAQLIRVGFEFCGWYALDEDDPRGFRNREPLTSAAALRRYLSRAEGVRGRKRALEALRFIADGSASPMETVLTMLLCLSTALGGYGLPLPRLKVPYGFRGRLERFEAPHRFKPGRFRRDHGRLGSSARRAGA